MKMAQRRDPKSQRGSLDYSGDILEIIGIKMAQGLIEENESVE